MNNGFIKRRWILLITGVLLLLALMLSSLDTVHAAAWTQMPEGTGIPTGAKIPLRSADAQATGQNGGMVKSYTTAAGAAGKALYVKIPDRTKKYTFTNFGTIKYPQAAEIRGRAVDVTIEFTSMTVYPEANPSLQNSDKTMTVARMLYSSLYVSSTDADGDSGMFYRGKKEIQTKVTVTWHDGGGVVKLPFYVGVSDIDASGSYFQESWIGGSGFDGTIYTWKGNDRILDKTKNQMTAPANGSTSGNDSWYKAGLIATTSQGSMTMTWIQGNCGAEMALFNQYKDLSAPTKTVDKASAVKGNTITWTVNQKIGTFYRDTFTPYTGLSISDPIPEGVEYQSARVYNGSADVTARGTLSYNESSRLLTFTFGGNPLSGASFYQGQTFSMKITAKALLPKEASKTISNQASTAISGETQNTNTVNTVIRRPDLSIEKKAEKDSYQSYEKVSYTVRVKQTASGLSARNVTISDTLPKEMALTGTPALSGASGTVKTNDNTWTVELDKLDYGETAEIVFTGTLGKIRMEKELTNKAAAKAEDVPETEASEVIRAEPIPLKLHVEKMWQDQQNFYQLRPGSVKVELLRDKTPIKELTLTEEDGWKGTFEDLPEYRTETEAYDYQVREASPPAGYSVRTERLTQEEREFERRFRLTNTLREYELTINKQMASADWYGAHGNATFLYQITSEKNPDWKWYEEITFTEEDSREGGETLRSSKTRKLPYGIYEVEELGVLRYEGELTGVSSGAEKTGPLKARVRLGPEERPEFVTYTNRKTRWDGYSHNDLVINELRQGGNT